MVVFPETVPFPVEEFASLPEGAVLVVVFPDSVNFPVEVVSSPDESAVWVVVFPDSVSASLRVELISESCHLMLR